MTRRSQQPLTGIVSKGKGKGDDIVCVPVDAAGLSPQHGVVV